MDSIKLHRFSKAAVALTATVVAAVALAACGAQPAATPSPTPDLGAGVTLVRGEGPRPYPEDLAEREGVVVPVHFTDCHGNHLLTVDSAEYAEWHEELDYITYKASAEAECFGPEALDEYERKLEERGLDPAVLEERWREREASNTFTNPSDFEGSTLGRQPLTRPTAGP